MSIVKFVFAHVATQSLARSRKSFKKLNIESINERKRVYGINLGLIALQPINMLTAFPGWDLSMELILFNFYYD